MCGICGKFVFEPEATVSPQLVKRMADMIGHRGPDDEGYHVAGAIGLGFRRLSIIDLDTGHQPLSNEDGTVWVVFNGEIYNYQELRRDLREKGHVLRTKSDTEVLVHLYEEYGPDMLTRLRGMFGFALWDRKTQTLLLARDRVGIKPLYYCLTDRSLTFGSEMKAILADVAVPRDLDLRIIDRFLTFFYVPGEDTLFRCIKKLAPGTFLLATRGKVEIHTYWDPCFLTGMDQITEQAAMDQLRELLEETVRLHMISDVPVGFLLSGGVDSTAMLSLASGKSPFPISSYTVGFSESGAVDERPFARLAAEKYGSEHYEITISSEQFRDFLPQYVWHMEEPVCEPPAIALYYVSRLAREHVKVLISGEGGDEAFGGYFSYRNFLLLERLKKTLGPARDSAGAALLLFNRALRSKKVAKFGPLFSIPFHDYYYSSTSTPLTLFNSAYQTVYSPDFVRSIDKVWSAAPVRRYLDNGNGNALLDKMLYVDTKTWLPDDLLIKADKMTMANSVELRVPFLDHKVLEFAARLPARYKVNGWKTKYIVKKALENRIPAEILNRRKAGFPVPYERWMRNELREWVREILFDRKTLQRGYFAPQAIESLVSSFESTAAYPKELFSLIVLELWHRQFHEQINSATA